MTIKKMGLRIASAGLAAVLLSSGILTNAGTVSAASPVSDTKGHWAESRIVQWMELGWVRGYSDGTFRPNASITRAEFAALVNRAFGLQGTSPIAFRDVKPASWAYTEVSAAVASGYAGGRADGTFRPDEPITRQEAASMIVRLLKLQPDTAAANRFADADSISEWSKGAVGAAAASGIIGGYADRTFRPLQTATRAEAISMLQHAIDNRGETYDAAGTYGPESGLAVTPGGVSITKPGVVLRNTVIGGDLTLGAAIGEGDADLNRVTVRGTTRVQGGGANSIHFLDSNLSALIVNKAGGPVRTVSKGTTDIGPVILQSPALLEEEIDSEAGFHNVELDTRLPAGALVSLKGKFDDLGVDSSGTSLDIRSGGADRILVGETASGLTLNLAEGVNIRRLEVNAPIKVTGKGTIVVVQMSAAAQSGSTFENRPLFGMPDAPTSIPSNSGGNASAPSQPTNEDLASSVSARIAALPDPASLGLEDEAAVRQALEAYESLTEAQKALVNGPGLSKLKEASARIEVLKAEFAADLAAAAEVDAQVGELPAPEAVSLADKAAIDAALASFDSLTPARQKLLGAGTLSKLTAAKLKLEELEAQLAADIAAADAAEKQILALPEAAALQLSDSAAVLAAKQAYEALTPAQQARVASAAVTALNAAAAQIADLTAANEVTLQIRALPDTGLLTLDQENAVIQAKAAYEALTSAQKGHIQADDLSDLDQALARMVVLNAELAADIAAADAVTKKIEALPEANLLTLGDRTAVEEAEAAYTVLTNAQKIHIQVDVLSDLNAAVSRIADLQAQLAADIAAAQAVTDLIAALPDIGLLTLDHEAAVDQAQTAYTALTAAQQTHVEAADLADLNAAVSRIADLQAQLAADLAAAEAVTAKIAALPDAGLLTLGDQAAVKEAKDAYEALTPARQGHVKPETLTRLNAATARIAELLADVQAAAAVDVQIESLPQTAQLVLANASRVQEVQAAYNGLTQARKDRVKAENVTRLDAAVAKIAELQAQYEIDLQAADAVTAKIQALPETASLTLDHQAAVQAAQSEYELLTVPQKEFVASVTLTKLTNAVNRIAQLAADKLAAYAVTAKIQALPETAALTLQDEPKVQEAQAAFAALTPAQQSRVSESDQLKLTNAAAKIVELKGPYVIASKDVTNLDYETTWGSAAQLTSKTLSSSDFSSNRVQFTVSDGQYTVPVDLSWNIPQNDGFTAGQVVGSAVESYIQQYFYDRGMLMTRTLLAFGNGNTFTVGTFQPGSDSQITLGGNWQALFTTNAAVGRDDDFSKNRTFTVSDGTDTAVILLEYVYEDLDDLTLHISEQLSASALSDATAVRSGNHFEIRMPRTHAQLTLGGADKDEFFTTFTVQ